jgi:hypothetical protein
MAFKNILIILGCLVAGYWIVNSVMGPGGKTPDKPGDAQRKPSPGAGGGGGGGGGNLKALPTPAATNPHARDWHVILDIPADSNGREIQRAYQRRLSQAQSSGDTVGAERIRLAYEAATRGSGKV